MGLDAWRYRFLWCAHALVYLLRRRFTPAGWVVLAGWIGSAAMGFDTDKNVAYQAFTFLGALLGLAFLSGLFSKAKFSIERRLPRFATAGEAMPYRIIAQNHSCQARSGLTFTEDSVFVLPTLEEYLSYPKVRRKDQGFLAWITGHGRWARWLEERAVDGPVNSPFPDIAAGGSVEAGFSLTPRRRGRMQLAGPSLSQAGPLGLLRSRSGTAGPATVLVLPKRYPVLRPLLPGHRTYQAGGVSLSSSIGESQEFMSLRDYRAGDPLRRIHWKSMAKTGKLIVKEYQEEYFERHALALDTFGPSHGSAVFEEAVSVAASFAYTLLTQESLLDLLFVGRESYCYTAGRGLAGVDTLLEVLASVQPCTQNAFSELEASVARRQGHLSGCVCVLLNFDEPRRKFVRRLESVGLPVQAFVIRKPGAPPLLESAGVRVLETGRIAEGLSALGER